MKRRKFIRTSLATAPLATLYTAALAETPENNLPAAKPFVVKSGQDRFNEPIKYRGISPNLVKVSAKDTAGQMCMFEYEGFAKMVPELHMHWKQDETFYILEGEFIFQLGDKKVKAVAGSTIFIPRLMPHAFLVTSEIGRTLFMLNPAGKVEELFARYDSYQTIPPIEELMRISAEFNMPVLGPKITAD